MFKFAVIFAVIGCSLAGPLETAPETLVNGGVNAVEGQFPWTASVRVQNDFFQGVVLNENHVLTAASVVSAGPNSINHFWVRVICGDLHVTGSNMNREERTLSHLFIHDQYNSQTGVNNIAVLRLSEPIRFPHNSIEGAIISTRIVPVGTPLQFAGWQIPLAAAENLRMLRHFSINTMTNAVCTSVPANQNLILLNQICAGQLTPAPPASVCQGNMGGGFYNAQRELVGILSAGFACGAVNTPARITETRFYSAFINQAFTRTDIIAPGTVFPRATPTAPTP